MNDGRREVEIYIRTTPDALWDAITNPEKTRLYWYHALNHSTWTPGARWTSESADGELWLDGEILRGRRAQPPGPNVSRRAMGTRQRKSRRPLPGT